jgi:very-short-patch-repair endonuclease
MVATRRMSSRSAGRWLDRADPLAMLLWRQSDVLTRAQALRHLSPAKVEHKLATGRWRRAHHGVYVTHDGPVTRPQLLWIAYLALGSSTYLAGLTAAESCGLRGYGGGPVHVLIPARRRDPNPPSGVVVHRTTRLTRAEVNPLGTPPHTTAARALVDAAQWAHRDEQARAVVAAGFQQRLVAGNEIHEVLARLTRARRRGLILEAATDALGGAHSLPEAQFVGHLRRAGLPLPRLQTRRRDARGGARYLDGYYAEWRIHLEIDGSQHLEARTYWQDMRRQNDLWIAGDRVLRFPSWAVRHHPAEVVAQVRAALLAAGWRPGP